MEETKINMSTCRKYLRSSGLRASVPGIQAFQREINAILKKAVQDIAETTQQHGSKTIQEADVINSLRNLSLVRNDVLKQNI